MRYFCPNYMDQPQITDKETFLSIMLKQRPEYAIVWDVRGNHILEFLSRVWVVQYALFGKYGILFAKSPLYSTR